MKTEAIQIHIQGRVQGVGFRYSTYEIAKKYNIKGWVKNEQDGSVLIEAEGIEEDVTRFLMWCHRGPSFAKVTNVKTSTIPKQGFKDFTVRHTY